MRKCHFKVHETVNTSNSRYEEGILYSGVFHQWGFACVKSVSTLKTVSFSAGIIETPSGDIRLILPEDIIFDEPLTMGD